MAALVWVLLVLAATSGCFADDDKSTSSSEEVVKPSVQGILPEEVDSTNYKTAKCPNGERYMSECNWCTCNEQTQVDMCTMMGCINWTCDLQLEQLARPPGCYGNCTCDSATTISTCERKGCTL